MTEKTGLLLHPVDTKVDSTALLLLPADADTKIDAAVLGGFAPTPIYMPKGEFLRPGVVDALEESKTNEEWRPNSHRTRLLVAAVEAAKDIASAARSIRREAPWKERRPIALLATPLVTMCDRTKDLNDQLGRETAARSHWPPADEQLRLDVGRRLKRHQNGAVRSLRNLRTAHIDLNVLRPEAQPLTALPDLLLPPLADTLLMLTLCLNYTQIFTWIRKPSDASESEVEIMTDYPIAFRAKVSDGKICALGSHALVAEDPRHPLQDVVLGLFHVYNFLAATADPPHQTIFATAYEQADALVKL